MVKSFFAWTCSWSKIVFSCRMCSLAERILLSYLMQYAQRPTGGRVLHFAFCCCYSWQCWACAHATFEIQQQFKSCSCLLPLLQKIGLKVYSTAFTRTHTHTHTHIHTHTYTHTYEHTHINTHPRAHTHAHIQTHIHAHTHTHYRIHTGAYTDDARSCFRCHTYTHIHDTRTLAHTHTHTRTHTHAHTHTHTHIHTRVPT